MASLASPTATLTLLTSLPLRYRERQPLRGTASRWAFMFKKGAIVTDLV
ncbi:MAG: hypothetical protein LDL41_25545 [Coleofasciculus sp. S288]|nr:hypothetical protein [Coleofasciculus sp. S288]